MGNIVNAKVPLFDSLTDDDKEHCSLIWLAFFQTLIQNINQNFAGFAAPSVTVGLTAKPGTLFTATRSDGAPALDQGISPTWTALHAFAAGLTAAFASIAELTGTTDGLVGADLNGRLKRLAVSDIFDLLNLFQKYADTTPYTSMDIVTEGGVIYESNQDSNVGNDPASNFILFSAWVPGTTAFWTKYPRLGDWLSFTHRKIFAS